MDKKLTLNQAWLKCLRMYKYVAANWKPGIDVTTLKRKWLNLHETEPIYIDCYFCEYTKQHFKKKEEVDCSFCPGKLVDRRFSCQRKAYYYYKKPKAFYKKLLALNEKRQAS